MSYDVDNDPYIDNKTGILRNLLDIRTMSNLDDTEAAITAIEITELTTQDPPPYDEFNAVLLMSIHTSSCSK